MAGSAPDTSMALLTEYYDALEIDPSSVHIREMLVELWQELGNPGMKAHFFRRIRRRDGSFITDRYGFGHCFGAS
jgi:hypothetical protein